MSSNLQICCEKCFGYLWKASLDHMLVETEFVDQGSLFINTICGRVLLFRAGLVSLQNKTFTSMLTSQIVLPTNGMRDILFHTPKSQKACMLLYCEDMECQEIQTRVESKHAK